MFDGIKITDIVSALSALIAAITGVVMAFLAYKTYLQEPQQDEGDGTESQGDNEPTPLLEVSIFKTSKQETKLRVEKGGIVCLIEDVRPNRGGRQWRLSDENCQQIVEKRMVNANPNYKPNTGLLSIGHKRNWLYSKHLFSDHHVLEESVLELVKNAVANSKS